MQRFERVLVGTDLSTDSDRAIASGVEIAVSSGGTLHVVHAIPERLRESDGREGQPTRAEIAERVKARVDSVIERMAIESADDLDITVHTRFGRSDAVIRAVEDETKADLIILGRHGSHVIDRLFLGSTTAKVANQTDAAILVTGTSETLDFSYDDVLVPLDLSSGSADLLDVAIKVADESRAQLHVLHVYEAAGIYEYSTLTPNVPSGQYNKRMVEQAENSLAGLLQDATFTGPTPRTYVRLGFVAGEVLDQAEKIGVQLIVLGSRRRTGFDRVLLGNTADRVMRRASCDVLVVNLKDA